MGVGWYCSGRQANFLREIVLEGQKQLRGLLQSVPAAAQLIYRQQPSWFWPSGRQAPPVWVAAGQSRKLIFAKWQNSKQAISPHPLKNLKKVKLITS